MGGLLRKKQKSELRVQERRQEQVKTASATTTPLFSRLATATPAPVPCTVDKPLPAPGEGEYAELWNVITQTQASDGTRGSASRKAKSEGQRASTRDDRAGPGKPLIFAAMAAVSQHPQSPVSPVRAPPPPPAHAHKALPTPPRSAPASDAAESLGVPLDDDPFAKAEGVKMLRPSTSASRSPSRAEETGDRQSASTSKSPSPMSSSDCMRAHADPAIHAPPVVPACTDDPDRLTPFLGDAALLRTLLVYFTFYDWCLILSLSRQVRFMVVQNPALREEVLERFLQTVGYRRWGDAAEDPLSLSLQDLSDYMRGVSTPTHEYARIAALYNHSLYVHPSHRDPALYDTTRRLAASCRAYTRVVLRLRAQAERDAAHAHARPRTAPRTSRPPSRAPSPAFSYSNHSTASSSAPPPPRPPHFQSPLFKPRRAPLLRVFVPSPDGDWLSDKSVLECEAECRRAGIMGLLRLGDVVWDVAVGDEANVGRLIWDGSYLIDLDYAYSPIGDLPKYMPTLAFPPSYFHRVVRTGGPHAANPIAHIDLRPWGAEIAANLQLLQDRVRTETPQGAHHNVVRWVHRSSFVVRPPRPPRAPPSAFHGAGAHPQRVPIPESGLFVDPGWYGTVVVETEGTNEALADLQERCGPGVFPPRPAPAAGGGKASDREARLVFRILREKSRPGEIWIRAVSAKEKIL